MGNILVWSGGPVGKGNAAHTWGQYKYIIFHSKSKGVLVNQRLRLKFLKITFNFNPWIKNIFLSKPIKLN